MLRQKRTNQWTKWQFIVTSLSLLLLLATTMISPAYAASLTVDSTADSVANDGACTLREAIINANNNDQSGSIDCLAGNNADTITFSVDGTITLGSTLPEITSEMTIDGAGHTVTVSGDNAYRVMVVNTSGTLNLNALTIVDGYADGVDVYGGGFLNDGGTLNVSNSTFTNNHVTSGGGRWCYWQYLWRDNDQQQHLFRQQRSLWWWDPPIRPL